MTVDHSPAPLHPGRPSGENDRQANAVELARVAFEQKPVGMGQIVLGQGSEVLTAVLGSCVAVALHCPRAGIGALAHIVLPDSAGRTGSPGKFADTAIPAMLVQVAAAGIRPDELYARLVGGACIFGYDTPLQVGQANAEAARRALAQAGIPVTGQDVGGNKGRRITLRCDTGTLLVEILGELPRAL